MSQLRTRITQKIYCGVEQLGARRAHNPKVTGSSPVPATKQNSSLASRRDFFCFKSAKPSYFLFSEQRL